MRRIVSATTEEMIQALRDCDYSCQAAARVVDASENTLRLAARTAAGTATYKEWVVADRRARAATASVSVAVSDEPVMMKFIDPEPVQAPTYRPGLPSPAPKPDLAARVADLKAQLAALTGEVPIVASEEAPVVPPPAKAEKPLFGGTTESPEARVRSWKGNRVIVTSAQNNTEIHPAWHSLMAMKKEMRADLLVARFGYDKRSWANVTKDSEDLWYAPEIEPYVCNEPTLLAQGLLFCAELDINPTASDPLSGLKSYTKSASGIIPHAKLAMESMPRLAGEAPRFLYTTGAITMSNYIQKKQGQKAEFHHQISALLVEVDHDGAWFVRQLVADSDGNIQDLDRLYTPNGSVEGDVECVTWGDFHEEKSDEDVERGCFGGSGSIIEVLRPREQHVHDLADMTARNHHNVNDPYFRAQALASGRDTVEGDMLRCAEKLARIERPWCRTVVVESNHDQALKKWLCTADGHRDASNARYWHYWNYRIFQAIEKREDLFVFEEAVRAAVPHKLSARFIREDQSWKIARDAGGIECALHGHRGSNGSRGSSKGFRSLGIRVNAAHSHSCGIFDGVYVAGVSGKLDMGYNVGPSSWSHSHIVTYGNGKRCIVTMRGSRWRADA